MVFDIFKFIISRDVRTQLNLPRILSIHDFLRQCVQSVRATSKISFVQKALSIPTTIIQHPLILGIMDGLWGAGFLGTLQPVSKNITEAALMKERQNLKI